MSQSQLLSLPVGQPVPPQRFPVADIRMDARRFDYEGNWLFCVFNNERLPAARLGFGRGSYDARDLGGHRVHPKDFLFTHLELMALHGAMLYTDSTNFNASHLTQGDGPMDLALRHGNDRPVLSINGWPQMTWSYRTPDDSMELRVTVDLRQGMVLPDLLLPQNCFAMWAFIGRIRGQARIGRQSFDLDGTAFFDHPRIQIMQQAVQPLGWLLYTPMVLQDGSSILGYLAANEDGRLKPDYCFAWRLSADNATQWRTGGALPDMQFDGDAKPSTWRLCWGGLPTTTCAECRSIAVPVARTWGDRLRLATRCEVENLPLLFDVRVQAEESGLSTTGKGLAEYITNGRR